MLDHHRALIYTMVIVSAADSDLPDAELRIIELIRDRLKIDRLIAAAIERSSRARFQTL